MNEVVVFMVKDIEEVVMVSSCCCFNCFFMIFVVKCDEFVNIVVILVVVWGGLEVLYDFIGVWVDS